MLPSPPADVGAKPRSKRKLDDVEAEVTRDASFHLENLNDNSVIAFEPVCKLLRAHLPLSWLAAANSTDVVPSGSLLKGPVRCITAWEYSTLVARLLPNGGLCALEKIDEDCYVSHTLQPFVSAKWVQDASIGASPPVNLQMMLHYLPSSTPSDARQELPSRRTPSLSSDSGLKIAQNRRGVAARLSILGTSTKSESLPASPVLNSTDTQSYTPSEDLLQTAARTCEHQSLDVEAKLGEGRIVDGVIEAATTNPTLDMLSPMYLRQRYLETLYTTKSPLAYYSKGPLSRARARARALDASINLGQLADFYRDSLLPAKKLDLKYRQSMREAIADNLHDPVAEVGSAKKTKRRTKLGKNGLWPMEPDYITKWWHSQKADASTTQLQQAISSLRMREAQMQILLILEIISIEAKQTLCVAAMPDNQDLKIESVEVESGMQEKASKSVKKRMVDTDLELLADKLCIWHSIGLEDTVLTVTDSEENEPGGTASHSKDSLRDFCTDILIPFYGSKLPVICKSLCKTLAGPELYERAAKAARLKDESQKSATPGSALQRRPASRSNTLERVLSDASARHSSPPTISRSVTLPPIPHFKREPSEAGPRQLSRQASMSFTSREVDLVADASVAATKKRKLDLVTTQKQELANAIQALKKPNRQTLGKTYMDEVESRKSKIRKPILITATPRACRKKTATDLEPVSRAEQMIPSSGVKQRNGWSLSKDGQSANSERILGASKATPSKNSSKKNAFLQAVSQVRNPTDLLTPVLEKHFYFSETPPMQKSYSGALHTPTKQTTVPTMMKENNFPINEVAFKTMDRAMQRSVNRENGSIYAQLGWEDE